MLVALTTSYAQTPSETSPVTAAADYPVAQRTGRAEPLYAIQVKAVRNFYNRYGDGNNESWYATDYGFRAKFQHDGISFMADYNKKGGWILTIKTYGENKLPKDIRERIRRTYYDQHIFLVQEIDQRNEPVYFVNIEDAGSWLTLRLAGDDMETVAEYEK